MSSSSQESGRPVVVTGVGVISPIGIGIDAFWESLSSGRCGIARSDRIPYIASPDHIAAEVKDFTDESAKKIYLKQQRKSIKVMCREIQMGVASAALVLEDSGLNAADIDHSRFGVEFGANLMLSPPEVLKEACLSCISPEDHEFHYDQWGTAGLKSMEPLWLLKYLPNMPACHIGIFADARGPSNSLTLDEASGALAIGEAYRIIQRGHADTMIAGTTGTKLHAVKTLHAAMWDELASAPADPAQRCRPFDRGRTGQVVAEGACSLLLETREQAERRGAPIFGTILGAGSSCVVDRQGRPGVRQALVNAMRSALRDAGLEPAEVGHINAHGLGERQFDIEEAQAILEVFGDYGREVPVTALKSYWGNSGAGSGVLELAGSFIGLKHGVVPPTLNFEHADPDCPLNVVHGAGMPVSNKVVLSVNVTRVGQAGAIVAEGE